MNKQALFSFVLIVVVTLTIAKFSFYQTAAWFKKPLINHAAMVLPEDKVEAAAELATTKWVAERKLPEYVSWRNSLNKNLQLVLVLSLLAFVALRTRKPTLDVPKFSVSIPRTLAVTVLAIGILYLWVTFGFTLNQLVFSRHSLQLLLTNVTPDSANFDHPMLRAGSVLMDFGFLDAWFIAYENFQLPYPYNFDDSFRESCAVVVSAVGVVYGISHALMFRLIQELICAKSAGHHSRVIGWSLLCGSLITLAASHLIFTLAGENRAHSCQLSILFSSILGLAILMKGIPIAPSQPRSSLRPRSRFAARQLVPPARVKT